MRKLSALVLLSAIASSAVASAPANHLPILDDDYGRARAEALRRHVPVFVEVWAPW